MIIGNGKTLLLGKAVPHTAYASDDQGSNFSLIENTVTLKYRKTIFTTSLDDPTEAEFQDDSQEWAQYVGLNGTGVPVDTEIVEGSENAARSGAVFDEKLIQNYKVKTNIDPNNALIIACGDSTTEQMNAYSDVPILRSKGERWENLIGYVNFGGSGHRLQDWVNGALGALPVVSTSNEGVSNWDYYGHKPIGSVTLATALEWRYDKADKVIWKITYGINDLILYAATGNLTEGEIVDYIYSYLLEGCKKIKDRYPYDTIVLDSPNPMTARPYDNGGVFPSQAAYPTFGDDDATDQALVEKWNQGLKKGYLKAAKNIDGAYYIDSWAEVFGDSDTTISADDLPFMGDLIHPSGTAYKERLRNLSEFTKPNFSASGARKVESELRAAMLSVNPWDLYPGYVRDNVDYRLVAQTKLIAVGSSYMDLDIELDEFNSIITGELWIVAGDSAAQMFSTYDLSSVGSNTRLFNIAVSPEMQQLQANNSIELYLSNQPALIGDDLYINSIAKSAKDVVEVSISNAGTGYIDCSFKEINGRPSTSWLESFKFGNLLVGSDIQTTINLSTASLIRTGASTARAFRILISGSYSGYAGKNAVITFDNDSPNWRAYEKKRVLTAMCEHQQNNKAYIANENQLVDGGVIRVSTGIAVPSVVTVDVYEIKNNARTSIGTVSIQANGFSANLTSGNPTTVAAGTVYEFVITSATSSDAPIVCKITEN